MMGRQRIKGVKKVRVRRERIARQAALYMYTHNPTKAELQLCIIGPTMPQLLRLVK